MVSLGERFRVGFSGVAGGGFPENEGKGEGGGEGGGLGWGQAKKWQVNAQVLSKVPFSDLPLKKTRRRHHLQVEKDTSFVFDCYGLQGSRDAIFFAP